ncbi:MAG: hypothetical protein LC128_13175, partial [Chitinophagales bacterium]|nr:hypothetical protein [Chitinophagales bacterium]
YSDLAETSTLTASGDKNAHVYQLFVLEFFLIEQVCKLRILESLEISQHHLSLGLQGIRCPFSFSRRKQKFPYRTLLIFSW